MTLKKIKDDLQIRLMTSKDIDAAMALKNLAGWNQTAADWERYLQVEPNGCFIAQTGKNIVGTATAITFGKKAGWIGMIITHPEFRGKGIGTALMYAAMGYLTAKNVRTQKLDATPLGFPLYKRLGFVSEYDVERQVCTVKKTVTVLNVRPISTVGSDELFEYDAQYFGMKRDRILASLVTENPELSACCVDDSGKICGYISARPGQKYFQIGPWIADTSENAENLLKFILSRLEGESVIVDTPGINREAIELCKRYHFNFQRGFIRMYKGLNDHPGIPQKIYGISGPEKG